MCGSRKSDSRVPPRDRAHHGRTRQATRSILLDRSILLTGMMGAGKSAVGRRLAERLGWPFIDTDASIEREAGIPIAEIFRIRGEACFRELERQTLEALPDERAVVALGGGALSTSSNLSLVQTKGVLVWLDATPETLALRTEKEATRPLLHGLDRVARVARLRALGRERAPQYTKARLRVETDDRSPEELAAWILSELSAPSGPGQPQGESTP